MRKIIFLLFPAVFLLFYFAFPTFAQGNKFGIHILEANEVDIAADLVNSSGGNWGYVTIVIREDDLNFQKWQNFMDKCRERHLIPLVRIATRQEDESWTAPLLEDAKKWAKFLNSLNWPVKDQYVIIFNEPNQAKEWGKKINPAEYARILDTFANELRQINPNFKILNAGFDLAALNSSSTMEAFQFWKKMEKEIPGIFNRLDGWASHSYPNHGFRGKPTDTGKTSIRGYQWELAILKKYFNLQKELPVFVTETGWVKDNLRFKKENLKSKNARFISPELAADYFKLAFENLWLKDERIVAVTPFVLNYPQPPFAEFSWIGENGDRFPQYEIIKNLPKRSWWPPQEEKYELGDFIIPPFMLTEGVFKGTIPIKNLGQSILGEKGGFFFSPQTSSQEISLTPATLSAILKPYEEGLLDFQIKAATTPGQFTVGWEKIGSYQIKVFVPSLIKKVELSIWEKLFLTFTNILKRFRFLLK
ncbi:MAG: hypothetical protein ACPLXP_02530 [Microgenomates group bacterium]